MQRLLILALLGATASSASAGICDDGYGLEQLRAFEHSVKAASKPEDISHLCMEQVIVAQPALSARFLAACDQLLAADPTHGPCVKYAIELGKTELGGHPLFDLVEPAFPIDPLSWETEPPLLYAKLADPRAATRLVEAWKAQLARKPPRAAWQQQGWDRFRGNVARFLGKHGGPGDQAFLTAQLTAVKGDDALTRAFRQAIAAIAKRAAVSPPAKPTP